MPRSTRIVGYRIALALASFAALTVVLFLATNVLPGDPARQALGKAATPQQRRDFRAQAGLDRPVVTRYVIWTRGMVVGDWGRSLITDERVRATVEPRLGRSAIIALGGFVLALPTAVLLGALAARRAGSAADTALSVAAIAVASLPEFVIAIAALLLLGVMFPILPVDSTGILAGDAQGYVLPSLALAAWTAPYLFRMVRANVRDVLGASYVRSAQLRGILGWRLAIGHIAPNAALPLVSVITLSLAELLGGVIVIENVFAFPGMGQLLVDSVRGGDYPIVQAIALVIGSTFILLNALADVAIFALDPRTRVVR